MGEIEVRIQLFADLLVSGEFPPVVGSNRMHPSLVWLEQASGCFYHCLGGLPLHLANQRVSRLSLDQADDGLPVVLADDGICLPVADTTSSIDDSRTLLNGLAVGDDAAPICLAITLPALLLTAQILPKNATVSFVGINPLVHRLNADIRIVADLVWTPLQHEFLLRKLPRCIVYLPRIDGFALDCFVMRLLGARAARPAVTGQLSADS